MCIQEAVAVCGRIHSLLGRVQVLQLAWRYYGGWEPGCRTGSDRLPRSGPKSRRVPAPTNHLFTLPVFLQTPKNLSGGLGIFVLGWMLQRCSKGWIRHAWL